MPVHDWTRVTDDIFHDFHFSWVAEIQRALRRGLLPEGYHVLAERKDPVVEEGFDPTLKTALLSQSPPVVGHRKVIVGYSYARAQRTLVIRHTSDDRIVAMIEVLSRGNKSSRHAIRTFVDKAVAALEGGIHLLLVDVHPPGPRDPNGIHGVLLNEIGSEDEALADGHLLTAAAFLGGNVVEAFVSHFTVGEAVPTMPLFLMREHYVSVPLEATYLAAWDDVPTQYQAILAAPRAENA